METETPVIFRKYGPRKGGEVIALFPCEVGTSDPWTCTCYVHVGQHGTCDPRVVMAQTRPATTVEYGPLAHELRGAPYEYRLKIYQRIPPHAYKARKAQLRQMERQR